MLTGYTLEVILPCQLEAKRGQLASPGHRQGHELSISISRASRLAAVMPDLIILDGSAWEPEWIGCAPHQVLPNEDSNTRNRLTRASIEVDGAIDAQLTLDSWPSLEATEASSRFES